MVDFFCQQAADDRRLPREEGRKRKLIQSTGEFALNIVGEELKEAALPLRQLLRP